MQIQSIVAAAAALTCLFATAGAVAAPDAPAGGVAPQLVAQASPATDSGSANTDAQAAAPLLRTGRASASRHRDARACLEKDSNPAIIKCAEKFRYR